MIKRPLLSTLITLLTLSITACSHTTATPTAKQLQVVATTSILADVVSRVGGDLIAVTTLVPADANEHAYQPSPRDIATVSEADLVFMVGLGLEGFMSTIIENASGQADVVTVSDGILTIEFSGEADDHHEGDPHVWLDPANVIIWVENITAALIDHDPANSAAYTANSQAYIEELHALDSWIAAETARIPANQRQIVTDHMLLGYFANKYNFNVVGAVIPSYSSQAEPSAKELAALEDAIRQFNVRVILVGNTINPKLAERLAEDTQTKLVFFYTGSLSQSDGPASTYLDYMRFNVNAIVSALLEE